MFCIVLRISNYSVTWLSESLKGQNKFDRYQMLSKALSRGRGKQVHCRDVLFDTSFFMA